MSERSADAGSLRYQSPAIPRGGVRRKVPAPFARPSITVGGRSDGVVRTWRSVAARDLNVDDVVPGLGLVHEITETVLAPPHGSGLTPESIVEAVSWTVTVRAGEGNVATYPATEMVWCFTKA